MGLPSSLVLIGAGKMGGALLEGWLRLGLDPATTAVIDPYPSAEMKALCEKAGVRLNPPRETLGKPEALALAIKPQTLNAAAPEIAPLIGPKTLVVSIMAGKTIANIKARLPARAVVRAMPNTPASVGRGVTAVAADPSVSESQRAAADSLLRAIGRIEWVKDETLIDAVTADALENLQAAVTKIARHYARGSRFAQRQLRMRVQVAADRDQTIEIILGQTIA